MQCTCPFNSNLSTPQHKATAHKQQWPLRSVHALVAVAEDVPVTLLEEVPEVVPVSLWVVVAVADCVVVPVSD